jgi:hypothetical protein
MAATRRTDLVRPIVVHGHSSASPRSRVRTGASSPPGKTSKSPRRIGPGTKHGPVSNARKQALARTFLAIDTRLLRADVAIQYLTPTFCKHRLGHPIAVALGQEVAVLDWDQRYKLADVCGATELVPTRCRAGESPHQVALNRACVADQTPKEKGRQAGKQVGTRATNRSGHRNRLSSQIEVNQF